MTSALATLRTRPGIWTTTHESLPAPRVGELASEIESLGYSALWIAEAWARAFEQYALYEVRADAVVVRRTRDGAVLVDGRVADHR